VSGVTHDRDSITRLKVVPFWLVLSPNHHYGVYWSEHQTLCLSLVLRPTNHSTDCLPYHAWYWKQSTLGLVWDYSLPEITTVVSCKFLLSITGEYCGGAALRTPWDIYEVLTRVLHSFIAVYILHRLRWGVQFNSQEFCLALVSSLWSKANA